jgi:hypothetical protein
VATAAALEQPSQEGAARPRAGEDFVEPRKFQVRFDNADWTVEFQFPRKLEKGGWLDVRGGIHDVEDNLGRNLLQIRIAMSHPFSANFMRIEPDRLEPILRIAASLALAERLAKLAGVETPGVIRNRI